MTGTVRRQAMTPPLTIKTAIALIALGALGVIGSIPAEATQAHAMTAVGQCRLKLPIIVSGARPDRSSVRRYRSPSGTASCTGALGPWLTGGQQGWESSEGAVLRVIGRHRGGTSACVPSVVRGSLYAEVPRLARYERRVAFSGSFRLRRVGSRLDLTGRGHLVPTRESPLTARLSFTGSASYAPLGTQRCNANQLSGTLTLELVVQAH